MITQYEAWAQETVATWRLNIALLLIDWWQFRTTRR